MSVARMSPLQYNLLKVFTCEFDTYRMSIRVAGEYKQTTFRSLLYQKWVVFDKLSYRKGFRVTAEGRTAMAEFDYADIMRKIASTNLTSYFHAPRGLELITRQSQGQRVVQMRRRSA